MIHILLTLGFQVIPHLLLAITPSIEFSIVSDHPKGSLTIHDFFLPLAPLEELKEGDEFGTDVSFDDKCGTFVK